MGEGKFEQFIFQPDLEEEIKKESPETEDILDNLEREKRDESADKRAELDSEKASKNPEDIKKKRARKTLKKDTLNFIEKHGVITKKEKKHTGKGIDSVRHPESENANVSKYEQLQQELKDHDISHPSEWRNALKLEGGETAVESDYSQFDKLFGYLGEEERLPGGREKIKIFSETGDSIGRLELLRTMSLRDAVDCIHENSNTEGTYRYLANRLDFYQKFVQDQNNNASSETVRLGLWRDMLYAAMQGTPEMGAVKIATRRINDDLAYKAERKGSGQPTKIKSAVELFGYYSGIFEGSIGQWSDLGNLYKQCFAQVKHRHEKEELPDDKLEHKAVRLMAKRLERAYGYCGQINTSASPYNAGFKEAIAAGQLGHKVMCQMRGMRNKIQETNFEHIERFIGKSGDNRYAPEKKRLESNISALKEWLNITTSGKDWTWGEEKLRGGEAAKAITDRENQIAVQKQEQWRENEIERLMRKFEKAKRKIMEIDLPEEEGSLQLERNETEFHSKIEEVDREADMRNSYFRNRTAEQLLADFEQRQILVDERFEKRKSLAQKALDLHFKINHTGGDYDSKPLGGIIDWINYAPLGAIKRAHKMMRLGMGDETITEHSLANIIAGQRGATREDLKFVHNLVEKAKGQDHGARQTLSQMMKVGNILSVSGYEASLAEVGELASKNFYGMTGALKKYNLEQVKQFIDRGINLQSLTTAKEITDKFGHNLEPEEVAEIASHNIEGLENALKSFDFNSVRTLLGKDVSLPIAVAVLNNTKQFGYELNVTQIANISKNVHVLEDFTSALRGLPLPEVEKIFSIGISFRDFNTVRSSLSKHNKKSDFTASLAVAQKLSLNNEYGNLDGALDVYSLKEIDQIITRGSTLSGVMEVGNSLKEKNIQTTLDETIQFEKLAGDHWNKGWNVQKAIDAFGIDDVRKIASKNCRLDKAVETHNYINAGQGSRSNIPESLREALKKGGIDVVIAIAKAGNMEIAVKTIEAGFTIEEITRFPFLISALVMKK